MFTRTLGTIFFPLPQPIYRMELSTQEVGGKGKVALRDFTSIYQWKRFGTLFPLQWFIETPDGLNI